MEFGLPLCYQLIKVLYIEQVVDTAQRVTELENGCREHLHQLNRDAVVDFTVVRDCVSGFEQMAIVKFDVLMVNEQVQYVKAAQMKRALKLFGYNIPVILIRDSHSTSRDASSLYFDVLLNTTDFAVFSKVLYAAYLFNRCARLSTTSNKEDYLQLTLSQSTSEADINKFEEQKSSCGSPCNHPQVTTPPPLTEKDEVDQDDWLEFNIHEI